MLSVVLVGGFLRFNDLGYSEFQGDEARAVLRAAEVIQGYHDALAQPQEGPRRDPRSDRRLLADRPAQRTIRTAALRRSPTSPVCLPIFLLGWRLYHPVAGWAAAMLLALDGYFIGFARIVQYQSIVFLMVVLVVLILLSPGAQPAQPVPLSDAGRHSARHRPARALRGRARGPCPLRICSTRSGDIAASSPARLGRALIAPIVVGGALLAVFYVPFVLNPSFRVTYAYITVNRIGGTFPYNNLVDVFERTTLYSSIYYVALLVICALISLISIYRRNLPALGRLARRRAAHAGHGSSRSGRPSWIALGEQDHTWVFFAAAMLVAWFLPDFPLEQRVVWIWFGATSIFMLFFTLTPNTHVYGFFIPWALIAGDVIGRGYAALAEAHRRTQPPAGSPSPSRRWPCCSSATTPTGISPPPTWRSCARGGRTGPAGYPGHLRHAHAHVHLRLPPAQRLEGQSARSTPDGLLDAPFEVHGKEPVADWYTRGDGYCPRDHVYYLWHESVEPADLGYNTVVREQIEADGYQLFGTVLGRRSSRACASTSWMTEPDRAADLSRGGLRSRLRPRALRPHLREERPVCRADIQHELDLRFGDAIQLRGYSLDRTEALPGEGVLLTLYWQADEALDVDYSVFTQIIDMTDFHKAGQRDGEPVCNNLPTTCWLAGDTIIDRYYIPIFADAPPANLYAAGGHVRQRNRRAARHLRTGRRAPRRPIRAGRDHRSARALNLMAALRSHKLLVATLLMALLIWLPRGLALDHFVTADEHAWLARSGNFYRALALGDFAATFQRHHPGVTTTWAGSRRFLTDIPGVRPRGPRLLRLAHRGDRALPAQRKAMTPLTCWLRVAPFVVLAVTAQPARRIRALHTAARTSGRLAGLRPHRVLPVPHRPFAPAASGWPGQQFHVPGCRSPSCSTSRNAAPTRCSISAVAAGLAWLTRSPALYLAALHRIARLRWAGRSPRHRRTAYIALAHGRQPSFAVWAAGRRADLLPALARHVGRPCRQPAAGAQRGRRICRRGPSQAHLLPRRNLRRRSGLRFYPVTWLWRTTPVVLLGPAAVIWSP